VALVGPTAPISSILININNNNNEDLCESVKWKLRHLSAHQSAKQIEMLHQLQLSHSNEAVQN